MESDLSFKKDNLLLFPSRLSKKMRLYVLDYKWKWKFTQLCQVILQTVGIGTTVATVVPLTDESNMDYVSYKAWLDAGNTPEAAD